MLTVRPLNQADLDLVCHQRREMFREAGHDALALSTMDAHFRVWLVGQLDRETYFGFVTEDGNRPIAGIGLMEIEWPPHPAHPHDACRGYVLNLYVEPTHRRLGIARKLMLVGASEFRARGIPYAILHSTQTGRPLYTQLGWAPTSEMAITL